MMTRTKGAAAVMGTARRIAFAALASGVLALPASAQIFPDRGGPAYTHDLVTGYQCVDNGCTVLRLPGTNCICTKQNPGEQDLSRLQLTCTTRERGQWVSCPYQPRYGN